jgi:MerR family copper efflux transcriptional regulator
MATLTIGSAARAADVNVETIRFYERKGLIPQPPKPRDGYRLYAPDTVERIRFIRKAQEIGFSLREIEELLSLRAHPETDCAEVRARAAAKIVEVDRKIAELKRVRAALQKVSASCPGHGALSACTILEALQTSGHADLHSREEDSHEDDDAEDRGYALQRLRPDNQGSGRAGGRREGRRHLPRGR